MTLDEVYEYFGGNNWQETMRLLGMSHNTYQYWRKIGYIPYDSQVRIYDKTGGRLLPRPEDAISSIERHTVKGGS